MAFRRTLQQWSNPTALRQQGKDLFDTRNRIQRIAQSQHYDDFDPLAEELDNHAQPSEYNRDQEHDYFSHYDEVQVDEQSDNIQGEQLQYGHAPVNQAYQYEEAYYAENRNPDLPGYYAPDNHHPSLQSSVLRPDFNGSVAIPRALNPGWDYSQEYHTARPSQQQQQQQQPKGHCPSPQEHPDSQLTISQNIIRLRPVSHLPDMYRAIFKKYGTFNAVQSACFDDIMNTSGNMVISAPTGSGKTVLFELAIIRMHMQGGGKCVYIAPTKALCTEKHNDWSEKFEPLGLKCYELTGDTASVGRSLWSEAKNASIIITTGEKWDSVTRGWNDHQELLCLVRLFLVDEVHVLGESRGSTLEVVVSRMKMRNTSLRFVLVSATIPNIDDISAWISTPGQESPAKVMQFGEEYRPCKLARHVVGVKRHPDMNSFMFARSLNAQLFEVIQTYGVGKPILIFDSTRKGVFSTAELLVKQFTELESRRTKVPWARPPRQAVDALFRDKRLAELAAVGIGVHHAGLDSEDRRTMEQLYIQRTLRVLVATSTLAVGVNLPAHFVIIKGVHIWQNGAECEYSDLDIMQMLGRAGRPQFDTEGVAVIMCEHNLVSKYQALTHGTRVLESCLHRNLSEHINSEIGMGTITDIESAKSWLRGSFFYQRVRRNPGHYAIGDDDQSSSWQERMDNLVLGSVQNLKENQLIEEKHGSSTNQLNSTEYGEIMSKFYIRQATMAEILAAPKNATLRDLMEVMSRSEEFLENKLRYSEKGVLNAVRRNPEIRFEIKKVETTADKIFVLTQAVLGGVSLNDPEYKTADCQLYMEVFGIFKHANRLCRAIVEVGIVKKNGSLVKHGLELVRCLTAKAWEDRPVVLRQIEPLGEKSIKVLAEHGATTIDKLCAMNPIRIEGLLKRAPPFGHKVVALAEAMPRYCVNFQEVGIHLSRGKGPVEVELAITCALANTHQYGAKTLDYKGKPRKTYDMTSVLTISSDYDFVDYRRIQTKVFKNGSKEFTIFAPLTKPSQSVLVIVSSDTHAGCTIQAEYKPKVQASEFPVLDTRPITSTELDIAGLEDDPDFWKMSLDSSDDVALAKLEPVPPVVRNSLDRQMDPEPTKKEDTCPPPARKMANGNYECNHACHDKSKCRHYWNGLQDAPAPPKKFKERVVVGSHKSASKTKTTTASVEKKVSGVQRLHSKSASIAPKKDTDLDMLEKVHNNASVSQSLRLTAGKRLKLESPELPSHSKAPSSKGTSPAVSKISSSTGGTTAKVTRGKAKKPERNYELSFADLGESSSMLKSDPISDVELSEDDDLPLNVMEALASGFTTRKNAPAKSTGAKAKTLVKAPSKTKTGTASALGLKRVPSTISLTSGDDEAPVSAIHAQSSVSKRKKQRVEPKEKERTPEPENANDKHDFGSPLFLRSDGDAEESTWKGDVDAGHGALVDDIEELLAAGSAYAFEAQTGPNLVESVAATQASPTQYGPHNFHPPELKTVKSSAPPSISSSHTLRTESLRAESPAPAVMEEDDFEEPLDDFADLEAWLQNGEMVL